MAERGRLRTYLGSAPGVGKTYAMLEEGARLADAGERVVIGWVESHDRAETDARTRQFELAPRRIVEYRQHQFEEIDVDAVLELSPDVVLVDELAHVSPDGSRHRWEDVADILHRRIDVLTTVNVANLDSARDFAARITGAGMVEPVPDDLVRASEVVLVDMPAEALRRRIAQGSVYSTDRVGGALARYFETPHLTALSELARAWIDDRIALVGEELARAADGAPVRTTVVAGVSTSQWAESVISHAASIADDEQADLLVVHVDLADGLGHTDADRLAELRNLATSAGAIYAEVRGQDVAGALANTAHEHSASHVVVARHRSRVGELLRGPVASRLRRELPDAQVDEVHTAE